MDQHNGMQYSTEKDNAAGQKNFRVAFLQERRFTAKFSIGANKTTKTKATEIRSAAAATAAIDFYAIN